MKITAWFKKLFSRKEDRYKPKVRTLYDLFVRFYNSDRDRLSMFGYIRENQKNCADWNKGPSKNIIKRYMLDYDSPLLAWYLLEQYFEGNIEIKKEKDVQPK